MADRYLIESSATDGYLLEDGSGVLLLEVQPVGSAHTHTFTGDATSVVQPYIVVYMWERTS